MGGQAGNLGVSIVAWIAIGAIVLVRAARPQRISVTRMWTSAGLLMMLAALAIYGGEHAAPAPVWEIALAVVLGLAGGVTLGMLRGHHTQVEATDRHGVMRLGASWATAGIYLGAFVLRALIRVAIPVTSSIGVVVGDGLLVFAIAIIGVTYLVVYRKYEALDHTTVAA